MNEFARPLDGMNALIIGGGGDGIGRAISRAFAACGAAVAVADLDPQRSSEAAQEVAEFGGRAVAAFGRLDTLVTVVGGQVAFVPAVRLHEMSDDDWDPAYEMNLRYVVRAARAAIRVFLTQGGGGSIVSVGSVAGVMAAPL